MNPVTDTHGFVQWLSTLSPAQIQAAYRHRKEFGDLLLNYAIEDGRVTSHFTALDPGVIMAMLEREGFRTPVQKEEVRRFIASMLQLAAPYNSTLCYRVYGGYHLFEHGMKSSIHDPESFQRLKDRRSSWDSTPSALVFWAPVAFELVGSVNDVLGSFPSLGQYRFQLPSASLAVGLAQAHQTRTGYRFPRCWSMTSGGGGFGESPCFRRDQSGKIELEMIDCHPAARPEQIVISPVLIVPIVGD